MYYSSVHFRGSISARQALSSLQDALTSAVAAQEKAYARSTAEIERAALARGMGRSSYTLAQLAGQGNALAEAVAALTGESEKKAEAVREQAALSEAQAAETEARLRSSFETEAAAKAETLRREQESARNSAYLTAVSSALGSMTQSRSSTTGRSSQSSTSVTTSVSGSGSRKKKTQSGSEAVDAVSRAG